MIAWQEKLTILKIASFQLIIHGAELLKAYDELNDPN